MCFKSMTGVNALRDCDLWCHQKVMMRSANVLCWPERFLCRQDHYADLHNTVRNLGNDSMIG
jgi:hypothetical protein